MEIMIDNILAVIGILVVILVMIAVWNADSLRDYPKQWKRTREK